MKYTIALCTMLLIFTACGKKEKTGESAGRFHIEEERPRISWFGAIDAVSPETEVSRKNFYIIFDGSGSMKGEKLSVAKRALKKFIQAIPEESNIGLYVFDSRGTSERAKLGSAKKIIENKVDKITAGGATPLGRSVKEAFGKIKTQAKSQLGYGDYNLVIITDGKATDSSLLKNSVDMVLNASPVIIHTIGFKIGTDHVLNQPGRIVYKTAGNYEELSRGLEKVLAETEDFTVIDFNEKQLKVKMR